MSPPRCSATTGSACKKIPLLIGGATTSRVHTAVKIAPHYEGPVVYVPDASRSVGVCSDLLSDERAATYIAELNADYARVREQHANKKATPLVTLAAARANKTPIDWAAYAPPRPKFIGRREFRNYDLAELAACIDWGAVLPDLGPGRYASRQILRDDVVGDEAHARVQRRQAAAAAPDRRPLAAGQRRRRAAAGQHRRRRHIEVYTDESRSQVALRWRAAAPADRAPGDRRRQAARTAAWPTSSRRRAPGADYIGLFAVTAGIGVEKKERQFVDDHDDYTAIMLKALADRLAEAFAERLHQRVRTELWGYAADEALSTDELIAEKYRGIRPAPGYPACPDHSVKRAMFDVLQAEATSAWA